ncbi:MAG: hypothetical protein ACI4CC_00545, partial [Lachnospiraceae bacterium]
TWKTFGLLAVLSCLLLMGCGEKKQATDYSEYGFTDITWVRQTEADTEYLTFGSDGSFSYYCACGEPVNDADLCEGYTYDDATKTIVLNCSETTEDMVTRILLISYDEQRIELNFDGEIRIFTREK